MFKRKPTQRHDRRAACVFIECRSRESSDRTTTKKKGHSIVPPHPRRRALFPAGARASVEPARFPFPVVLAAFAAAFCAFAAALPLRRRLLRMAAAPSAARAFAAALGPRRLLAAFAAARRRMMCLLRHGLSVRPASPMSRATCARRHVSKASAPVPRPRRRRRRRTAASSRASSAAVRAATGGARRVKHVRPALAALHVRARRDARGDLGPR